MLTDELRQKPDDVAGGDDDCTVVQVSEKGVRGQEPATERMVFLDEMQVTWESFLMKISFTMKILFLQMRN